MRSMRVFVWDLHPRQQLATQLEALLHSSVAGTIAIERQQRGTFPTAIDKPRNKAASSPDVVFVVLTAPPDAIAPSVLRGLQTSWPKIPILAVMDDARPDDIAHLLELGATDFLVPPLRENDVLPRLWRFVRRQVASETSVENIKRTLGLERFIGESPLFLAELKRIPVMGAAGIGVLIEGETGTGKEIYARAIHHCSPRADKPFIPVNCGAIPIELVENELFGHEAGAFTGASSSSVGLVQEAAGGTLFLDEIDSLPLLAQVKLLRFLQNKEYRPLGSHRACQVDVRVIAATNVSLEEAVRTGRFRQDLLYRLNVLKAILPPLRERGDDIMHLTEHFLRKFAVQFDKPHRRFSSAARLKLLSYQWPGNVRQLENAIQRAVILAERDVIDGDDIALPASDSNERANCDSFHMAKAAALMEFQTKFFAQKLQASGGNISKAAKSAGIDRRHLQRLLRNLPAHSI